MKILAADVGGTNTRLGYYEWSPEGLQLMALERFASHEHENLEAIARQERREPCSTASSIAAPAAWSSARICSCAASAPVSAP